MKKAILGCVVLLSVAAVMATKDGNKKTNANRHSYAFTAYNFANDTVPKKDSTKPKKDTSMLKKN
jgi:hypothetical protein